MNRALPTSEQAASRTQRIVSAPGVSAWVDASAGSGKTKVLTDRALRLMLAGARPERILCLTFTKAAAAEMANRIVDRLARWASVPEAAVHEDLTALGGAAPSKAIIAEARALFAKVVDAPGGLKVQTVHSFCQAALERFPVEAGAPPAFTALDERAAATLMTDARNAVLRDAMTGVAEPATRRALDRLAERGDASALDAVVAALLAERGRLQALGDAETAVATSLQALDFPSEADAEDASATTLPASEDVVAAVRRLVEALAEGKKTDKERAAQFSEWLAAEDDANLGSLLNAVFTEGGDGKPRANIATKDIREANAWVAEAGETVTAYAAEARDLARRAECALDTTAAIRLAAAVGARYEALKANRAALDFDDLILKTRDLLTAENGAGWALFKLDQGVDHILVDEAQDTNPEQWEIIEALAGEFHQHGGDAGRTVFAVGDPKQSIFSFQRADPKAFEASRKRFKQAIEDAGQVFEDERPLIVSFRSVPAVLEAVDAVFAAPPALDGLTLDDTAPTHDPTRVDAPGRVELWPLMPKEDVEKSDPWTPLQEYPAAGGKGEARLAEIVADKIESLIADPAERLPAGPNGRPARRIGAGDIMVVVQRRGRFIEALAQALKRRNVATSGVDRMRLPRQLAVRDLMALGQAAILPEDDLSLACFLKSPLGGLSEDDLFRVAHGRGRTPLWRNLKQAASTAPADDHVAEAWTMFREAMARADYAPPFDFFQWALGPMLGRARLVAALGAAALDPIDEFLALALRDMADGPSSLTGFLHRVDQDAVEIKRELEGDVVGVRLMTAHAAKGLQAPIVFLPDTVGAPPQDRVRLFWTRDGEVRAPLLGPTSSKRNPDAIQALNDRRTAETEEERRRLLYVAMTRAEDRLYVMGWRTEKNSVSPTCWHSLVRSGFERLNGIEQRLAGYSDDPILAYVDPGAPQAETPEAPAPTKPTPETPTPDWWGRKLDTRMAASPVEAPSRLVVDEADDPPAALSPLKRTRRRAEDIRRFGRGLLIHRLLERLPEAAPADRRRLGEAYLARAADLEDQSRDALLDATLALIEDPAFGDVFGKDALAEAPIAGTLFGRRYAGVIDRLLIADSHVAIIDFKTNRPPPEGPTATPEGYLRQMAVYRALARQAFPGKVVRTAILWTEAPRLDPLSDALLDAFAPSGEPAH